MASDWTAEVIAFLSRNLPVSDGGLGWDHMFSTAYQIGCEALVALGHADETPRGAVPRQNPRLPDVLPRWDDICVSVLWLAAQQGKLAYRPRDGGVPPRTAAGWTIVGAPPPPASNVASAHGLGPAYASPEVLSVLGALGLIVEGSWSAVAETVLWRGQPPAWQMDIASDPRFSEAARQACVTVPDDVRADMDRLATVSEADVDKTVAESTSSYEEMRAKYGPKARLSLPFTAGQARGMLERTRPLWLDDIFFSRWRLDDGWLTHENANRALAIFHDRLAIAMRRAVVARLYPDVAFFADSPRPNGAAQGGADWPNWEPPEEI